MKRPTTAQIKPWRIQVIEPTGRCNRSDNKSFTTRNPPCTPMAAQVYPEIIRTINAVTANPHGPTRYVRCSRRLC